jgi:hypothetical protein
VLHDALEARLVLPEALLLVPEALLLVRQALLRFWRGLGNEREGLLRKDAEVVEVVEVLERGLERAALCHHGVLGGLVLDHLDLLWVGDLVVRALAVPRAAGLGIEHELDRVGARLEVLEHHDTLRVGPVPPGLPRLP